MRTAVFLALAGVVAGVCAPAGADEAYRTEIQEWRDAREAGLRAEDGWLSLVGLFWLEQGPNRFGSDPSSDMVLPKGSSPASAGVFRLDGERTTLELEVGVAGRIDGQPVTGPRVMEPDTAGHTIVEVGSISMYVIERGGRFGIRAKDKTSPLRMSFKGLSWYPVDEGYRIEARWVSYPTPRPLKVPNVTGQIDIRPSPGHAEFELDGQVVRLNGVFQSADSLELFFILRDQTSGRETYGAGRFLYADPPKQGKVILDFNKSYSPPCAFTPYATCPLPPKENWLPVPVKAGEKASGAPH